MKYEVVDELPNHREKQDHMETHGRVSLQPYNQTSCSPVWSSLINPPQTQKLPHAGKVAEHVKRLEKGAETSLRDRFPTSEMIPAWKALKGANHTDRLTDGLNNFNLMSGKRHKSWSIFPSVKANWSCKNQTNTIKQMKEQMPWEKQQQKNYSPTQSQTFIQPSL